MVLLIIENDHLIVIVLIYFVYNLMMAGYNILLGLLVIATGWNSVCCQKTPFTFDDWFSGQYSPRGYSVAWVSGKS